MLSQGADLIRADAVVTGHGVRSMQNRLSSLSGHNLNVAVEWQLGVLQVTGLTPQMKMQAQFCN